MEPEPHVVSAAGYTRDVWLIPGPSERPHRICVFLDAEHYLRDMQCPSILAELQESGVVSPMTYLFVSHVSGADRHADLVCNEDYAKFIAEDAVGWALRRNPKIQELDNVICGLSLSGLAGAHIAFRYPQLFSYALSQSGSFWWLADNEVRLAPTRTKFWMSVGDEETATDVSHPPTNLYQRVSQIEGVALAAQRFRELGGTVKYNIYRGGHAIAPWKEELAPALRWLLEPNE